MAQEDVMVDRYGVRLNGKQQTARGVLRETRENA